ncbi:hypothetical protein DPMN_039924 [Dreissena polymorpha]|uniref:Uncharacterized protein n=1 Tax=Dreissena polymorpha TaxID=45954 RepID=A0A9D4HSK5_DREPO|nr:hypothetical protein DPMN_039924 [Dreissena polymorpha]
MAFWCCRKRGRMTSLWLKLLAASIIFVSIYFLAGVGLRGERKYDIVRSFMSFERSSEDKRKYISNLLKLRGPWLDASRSNTAGSGCVHPNLPLWTDQLKNYFKPCVPVKCSDDVNWVYTDSGRFYISSQAEKVVGKIECELTPIVNDEDNTKYLETIKDVKNGSGLVTDTFKSSCTSSSGKSYTNIHVGIAGRSKTNEQQKPPNAKYNVFMYGFDSMSRNMVKRFLPKTHEFFVNELGGHILNEYNIVGDGTPQALMPILTGRKETEIPEVRRGHTNAKPVDEILEFVWKRFEKRGYVTQWGEDMSYIGTFTYRMLGFKEQPVHHYMRPYQVEIEKLNNKRHCHGNKGTHTVFLDWLMESLRTNLGLPIFSFGFFSDYTHDGSECVGLIDDGNVAMFKYMKSLNLFKNTFIILMSDHGARFGALRQTEQGKLEERMPYFGIFVPPDFRKDHPNKYTNFLESVDRLTTPFDIYETLLDILEETNTFEPTDRKSYSLFSKIPKQRSCSDAGIEPHWCACLNWQNVSTSDSIVAALAEHIVESFNKMLANFSHLCHKLILQQVITAVQLISNDHVLKFKQSKDNDGRIADFSDNTKSELQYFQLKFETMPGEGRFEATVSIDVKTGKIFVGKYDISRINKYNDAPKCIADKHPELRPYCVCI